MSIPTAPRRELASRLAEKCRRRHIIVWDDPDQQYESVVDDVVPVGWGIERYTGSWWDLRRRVEGAFSKAEPPKLVVYVHSPPPTADPLEEIRRAGGRFHRPLPKILKDALAGELSSARVTELGAQCSTLVAVEGALEVGHQFNPVLIAELGVRDPEQALAKVLLESDVKLSPGARSAVMDISQTHLGLDLSGDSDGSDTATIVSRHLLLAGLAVKLGDVAISALVPTWEPLTDLQYRHAHDLTDRASRPETFDRWGELADQAASELRLVDLGWRDGLLDCDVARFVDDLAFTEAARLLAVDRSRALELASHRCEHSRWLRWRDTWSTRALVDFSAVRSIARLDGAIEGHPAPQANSLAEVHRWYADGAWRVDRAHRLMEAARMGLGRPGLDAAFTTVRQAYLDWLDRVLQTTNRAATASPDGCLPGQADVFAAYVDGDVKTAVVIVDAMRLELGHRLGELLAGARTRQHVSAAVALPPTVTAVGMANLLPDAAAGGVTIDLEGGSMAVRVAGRPIRTVEDRTLEYRRAAGRVEDHRLGDWLSSGDDVLADRINNADLLIVRSQDIDAAGEQDLATVRWSQIDAALEALATLVGRLTSFGVSRVVVTADHGFLSLGRPLDPSRVCPTPTGTGVVVHGRAWVGRPGTVPDGCTALALADFGVTSHEDIVVTDRMTAFGSAGASFFHGGISPQELIVPVVIVDAGGEADSAAELPVVDITVPDGRISAEAFSTRIALGASLFATDVAVRVTAANDTGANIARLVSGESVDPHTGTVHLEPGSVTILTFLVTEDLDKDQAVQIMVLDAATGRELKVKQARVARNLRPEEEW